MKIEFKFIREWQIGKCLVLGNHLYNPNREVQEHLETMYFIGFILIIVKYKFKFKQINNNG